MDHEDEEDEEEIFNDAELFFEDQIFGNGDMFDDVDDFNPLDHHIPIERLQLGDERRLRIVPRVLLDMEGDDDDDDDDMDEDDDDEGPIDLHRIRQHIFPGGQPENPPRGGVDRALEEEREDMEQNFRDRFPGMNRDPGAADEFFELMNRVQERFRDVNRINPNERQDAPRRPLPVQQDPVQQIVPPLPARLQARFFGRPQQPANPDEADRVPLVQQNAQVPRYPIRVRQIIRLQVLPYDNSRHTQSVLVRSGMIEMYFIRSKLTKNLRPIVETRRMPQSDQLILPEGCTTNVGLWTNENINQWMTKFIVNPDDQEIIRKHRLTGLNCFHYLRPYGRVERFIMRTPLTEERIRVFAPPPPEDPATPAIPQYAKTLLKAHYNKAYNLYNGHRR